VTRKISKVPAIASIIFLVFAAVGRWSYGFYTLLRLVVCLSAAYFAFTASQLKMPVWMWIMVGTVLLFNPLLPVRLSRSEWQPLDFIAAVVFVIVLFVVRESITR
jgi:hypothetical protein